MLIISVFIQTAFSHMFVVGTPVRNSGPTKKRFYCAVFGGLTKVGPNYTAYLYLFDECEASFQV